MTEEKHLVKRRNKQLDLGLLIVTLVLLAFGVIMVLSASAPSAFRTEGDSFYYFKRQGAFALVGIVVMLIFSRIDYRVYLSKYIYWGLLGFALALLILVLIPGVGVTRNDATRWINVAGLQFQPSEIMKIALIIFMSATIAKNPDKMKQFWKGFVPYLILVGMIAGLLLLEPHMSATVIMVVIAGAILIVGGVKKRFIIPFGILAFPAAFILSKVSLVSSSAL